MRDHLRSRSLRFWQKTRGAALDVVDISDWLPDGRSTPESLAVAQRQVAEVWKAVQKLSAHQRTVFALRFVEEMELDEIAAALDMNLSTVKSHLYRALALIRERMEENDEVPQRRVEGNRSYGVARRGPRAGRSAQPVSLRDDARR